MGLFGFRGPKFRRVPKPEGGFMWLWSPIDYSSRGIPVPPLEPIGEPHEIQFAVAFLRDIAERLEQEVNDVPSEYLVLQAAGMYILHSHGVVKGNPSLKAVLHEAQKILQALGVQRTITETHEKKVQEVVNEIESRHAGSLGVIIGNLDNLLEFMEREGLPKYR